MIVYHSLAIILAYVIDLAIGDPKHWPHPVKGMGSYIAALENRLNKGKYRKSKGLGMLVSLLVLVFGISFTLTYLFYQWHPLAGMVLEGILIATTIAQKDLKKAAMDVAKPLNEGNIQEARKQLSFIVGRDTNDLSEQEIVRGTVETVAENTSDGVTAPLFWAMIGGAPFALLYRAVNTGDSMVGYKNKAYQDFGWASARFDDLVNWIPARLTAYVTMISMKPKGTTFKHAWTVLFRDAKKHNSPNSGWGETSVAAILGIQLGGVNYYQGEKSVAPKIGEAFHPLETNHITKAVAIMQRTVCLFLVMLLIGGFLYELASSWL